jgi:hypothetical protein
MRYLSLCIVLLSILFLRNPAAASENQSSLDHSPRRAWFGPEYPAYDPDALICHSISSLGNPADPISGDDKAPHLFKHAVIAFSLYKAVRSESSVIGTLGFSLMMSTLISLGWEQIPAAREEEGRYVINCSVPDIIANFAGWAAGTVVALLWWELRPLCIIRFGNQIHRT